MLVGVMTPLASAALMVVPDKGIGVAVAMVWPMPSSTNPPMPVVAQQHGNVVLVVVGLAVCIAYPPSTALRVIGSADDRGVGAVATIVIADSYTR